MTSSTLAGERRWASARRGGMTVLGKVAVPKPLNLPSQRLENHGLDPTVEIVPKGTLNWGSGSRPSTNPWGSSLSPTPDSSSNSTNLLSGRPSSGGSGTRPSTGGSDRPVVEPSNNAWGPNSRPSSASGVLASNQSSLTSLRPHSAEARPVSSQLSRFAEPVSESSGAWGGSGTAERLGVVSSKKEDFSLSSGDFPTLGTESKDQGSHSRPTSASDRVPNTKDKTATTHPDETVNQGTRGIPQNVGDPCMEKWQGEHHQYFNPNMPPQHFDGWRGPPPMNGPPVWYGGPPHGPPPYGGGPGPGPGGYPVEPFPYYHHRPQLPPPPFPNSQAGPPPRGGGPGPGPRGHHPNTGNAFRPQMPDPYARPGMPFRPNFYPPMGFDGYYRPPPMGYCNSNERDNPPYMGMGGGGGPPPVYDRFPPQNAPDPNDGYPRTGGPGPGPGPRPDNEPAHPGPYKVILKHHNNEWGDEKEQGEKRVHVPPVKDEKARKYEWGAEDNEEEEDIYSNLSFEKRGVSDTTVQAKSSQGLESMKQVESVTSSSSSSSHMVTGRGGPALLSTPKDPTLMRKIEGLNAKVRASDERVDYGSNVKDISTNKGASHSGYSGPNPQQMGVLGGDKAAQPIPQMSRRPYNEMQSRTDHHGKGRFGNQEPDGWRKRPVSGSKMEPIFNAQERDQHQSVKSAVMNPNPLGKNEDFHDSAEQRAKLKEMVKERGLRLQKEEEERIREQKAKALAKLEELNRRMQSGKTPESGTHQKEEMEPIESVTKVEPPVKTEAVSSQTVGPVETSKSTEIEPVVLKEEVVTVNVNVNEGKSGLQVNEGGPTRHNNKRTSYKQKQAITTTIKSSNEKSVSDNTSEAQKPVNDSVSNVVASSEINSNLPNSSSMVVSETSGPQKRKNNKGGKNKNKQDNAPAPPPVTVSPVNVPPSESIPPPTSQASNITVDPTEHREDQHGRVNMNTNMTNQWKPHQPRRMPRNQQVNKFHSNEAVVWAPVQSHNKPENKPEAITVTEDPKPMVISVTPVNKSDNNPVHNNAKSKRAEIERYVPKPVAQHIELQHPGPPDETVVQQFKEEVVITNSSKHGKVQGAWRPRGPTDVIPNKGSSSQSFDPEAKSDPKSDLKLDPKSDTSRSSDVAAPDIPVVTGRGKSHTNRGGHKSVRGGAHVQSHATPDISQSDSSHWQPKTQKGSQNVGVKKEYNPRVRTPPQHEIESNESGTHEVRRERKFNNNNNNTSKGHVDESSGPHHPPVRTHHSQRYGNQTRDWSGHDNNNNNNNNMGWSGQGHDNRERQYNMDRDNRPRSGGPYNNRPRSGQDNRPMENRHYEYQPVGSSSSSSYNNNMKNNNGDGSQYGGGSSRYREKGRGGYSKRGGGGNGGGGGGNGGGYREQQQITPVHVEADAGWE